MRLRDHLSRIIAEVEAGVEALPRFAMAAPSPLRTAATADGIGDFRHVAA